MLRENGHEAVQGDGGVTTTPQVRPPQHCINLVFLRDTLHHTRTFTVRTLMPTAYALTSGTLAGLGRRRESDSVRQDARDLAARSVRENRF